MILGIIVIILTWFTPMPLWLSIVSTVASVIHIGWRIMKFIWSQQDYD